MELVAYKAPQVEIREMDHQAALAQASDEFENALSQVAEAAELLSDNADHIPIVCGDYLVDIDDMERLRGALKQWSKASSNLLKRL